MVYVWRVKTTDTFDAVPISKRRRNKAGENLQSKSLFSYRERFAPELCLRTSLSDFRRESWLCNVPLYGLRCFLANATGD